MPTIRKDFHVTTVRGTEQLTLPQIDFVYEFSCVTHETFFLDWIKNRHVPSNCRMWFFSRNAALLGFAWAQIQLKESGGRCVRVHAMYIPLGTRPVVARGILRMTENFLSDYAHENGADEIGFYTRRNPKAFVRLLNQTARKEWSIDSHVLTRRV